MKIIVSYQSGRSEIVSVSQITSIGFGFEYITITDDFGNNVITVKYADIRSIVIA